MVFLQPRCGQGLVQPLYPVRAGLVRSLAPLCAAVFSSVDFFVCLFGFYSPGNPCQRQQTLWVVAAGGGRVLLTSSGRRPGMRLSILQAPDSRRHKESSGPNVGGAEAETLLDML